MSRKQLVPNNVLVSNHAPSARDGDMYYDKTMGRLRFFVNGSWNDIAYLSDINAANNNVDGGLFSTTLFSNNIDGGLYNTTLFDVIIDSGVLV